jgi:hypothetical protein
MGVASLMLQILGGLPLEAGAPLFNSTFFLVLEQQCSKGSEITSFDECAFAAKDLGLGRWTPLLGGNAGGCKWYSKKGSEKLGRLSFLSNREVKDQQSSFEAADLWWGDRIDAKQNVFISYICRTLTQPIPFPIRPNTLLENDYYGSWQHFPQTDMPKYFTSQELDSLNRVPGWWSKSKTQPYHGSNPAPHEKCVLSQQSKVILL